MPRHPPDKKAMIKDHVRTELISYGPRDYKQCPHQYLSVLSGLNLENNKKGFTGELLKVHNGTHSQSSLTRPPGKFEIVVVTRAGQK